MRSTCVDIHHKVALGSLMFLLRVDWSTAYGCQPKNRGGKTPKMDGENNGKPY